MNTAGIQFRTRAAIIRVPLTTTTLGCNSCRIRMVSSEFTDSTFVSFTAGIGDTSSANCRENFLRLCAATSLSARERQPRRNAIWPKALPRPSFFALRFTNFRRDSPSSTMTPAMENRSGVSCRVSPSDYLLCRAKRSSSDGNMILKLGIIECTLGHVLALHAVTFAQALEVVENTPQHADIFFQVRAEIMRMPPQVVCQTLPGRVGQIILDTPFLQCLGRGHSGSVGAKKTASRKIDREIAGSLGQRITIVRQKIAVRINQSCRPQPAFLVGPESADGTAMIAGCREMPSDQLPRRFVDGHHRIGFAGTRWISGTTPKSAAAAFAACKSARNAATHCVGSRR